MENNNVKNSNGKGIVIAELTKKTVRKDKNKDTFWILDISIGEKLTEMYFELSNKKQSTLTTNKNSLFVFPNKNKNRFAYTLMEGYVYLFKYSKQQIDNKDYLHVEDWRKLSDNKRALMRSFRALLDKKEEESEEEELTSQELLLELKKRLGQEKITFNLSALDGETDKIWKIIQKKIDAELVDTESSFVLDLKEKEEE